MEVNLNRIIDLRIPIEGYLVMFCLYNEDQESLINYVTNVNKIPTKVFLDLVNSGYLTCTDPSNFNLKNIELTDKFKNDVLKISTIKGMSFNDAFDQLKIHYPTKVPNPSGGPDRRLHGDPERCKRLYKNIIGRGGQTIDEEVHSFILQCINFEYNEKKKSNSLGYFQLLATYLSKKSWELVEEDVRNLIIKNGSVENMDVDNDENKTRLGSEDF